MKQQVVGADNAVQQMNRSINISPVNEYGSSVVKIKDLKGEEYDMRKVLSIFIAGCLVLSLFTGIFVSMPSAGADTYGDYQYTVSGGNATITGYTGSGGAVVIPGTLGGYPVTSIGDVAGDVVAFLGCTTLTSVTIPTSVTSIGLGAFQSCTKLAAAHFLGNAPTGTSDMLYSFATGFTVYYVSGTIGWTNPCASLLSPYLLTDGR